MNRRERRKQKKISPLPTSSQSELLKAIQFHSQQQFNSAENIYLKIISIENNNYQALRHLGILYHDMREYKKAIEYLEKAIKTQPLIPDAYNNLGSVYFVNDEIITAKNLFDKSIQLNKSYLPAVNNLSRIYFKMNERENCMELSLHALKLAPDGFICKLNYALALSINGQINKGIKILEDLKHINKTDDLFNQLALMYEVSGNIIKSNEYLLESFKLNNNNYAMLAKLMDNNVINENDLSYKIEERYNEDTLANLKEKHHLARCLYIKYNQKKNFSLAGKYLVESNQFRNEILKYDIQNDDYYINQLMNKFDQKQLSQPTKNINNNNEIVPIFIVGMPRSGTTLTEQILASHSKIHGGGELDLLRHSMEIDKLYDLPNDLADNTISKLIDLSDEEWLDKGKKYINEIKKLDIKNKSYVTDKMPHNFIVCGLIHKMLPQAKIIYCYRDPMDNCFSLYRNTFGTSGHGYSYDQSKLVTHYNLHVQLMKHWKSILGNKIFLLKNEKLIDNQKEITSNLLKYCGLAWEDQCLEFYKTKRDVRTISIRQVRNPINKNSLGVWKNYADSLSKMQENLVEFT